MPCCLICRDVCVLGVCVLGVGGGSVGKCVDMTQKQHISD